MSIANDRYSASKGNNNGEEKKRMQMRTGCKDGETYSKHDIRSVSYVIHIGYIILDENGLHTRQTLATMNLE